MLSKKVRNGETVVTEHYYAKQPAVESDEQQFSTTLRGQLMHFYSDRGVFAKKGIDFGTKLLIDTLQLSRDAQVIDVGCGYGPIGLSIAKESSARSVTLVDVNERAVKLARKNAEANNIQGVDIYESDLFSTVERRDFDAVITNPPIRAGKQVVYRLFEAAFEHLKAGGQLWLVMHKKHGDPSAFQKLTEQFGRVEEKTKKKGYRIFCATKMESR
jgi:16S rRNA (guanine1207-N2)-methyltransferase